MASQYSAAEIFQFQSDEMQFKKWNTNESDADFVEHAKKVVLFAIQNELTEKEREYYTLYYVQRMPMTEIAKLKGVYKSTVSRALTRATKKLHNVMRYTAPHLLHTEAKTGNTIRNRKWRKKQ